MYLHTCVFCLLYLCQSGKRTGDKVSRQAVGGVLKPVVCVYSCSVICDRLRLADIMSHLPALSSSGGLCASVCLHVEWFLGLCGVKPKIFHKRSKSGQSL